MIHYHCLGLNHQTASVSLRERVAFDDDKTRHVLARVTRHACGDAAETPEMIVLSTCNRVEIYLAASELSVSALKKDLAEIHGFEEDVLADHFYHYEDEAVVQHLFRVAAGLDSLVPGEPQILGQVSDALEIARSEGTVGLMLSRLFQAAISAGKRARSETNISRNPGSISSLAASLAEESVPNIKNASVVVIGSGEMAELAVEALRKRGASDILVINRTLSRARQLAEKWRAKPGAFGELENALRHADIVISSTGAPHLLIHRSLVSEIQSERGERPLVLIDIAVPRDIDPQIGCLPGVRLYDMDGLKERFDQSLSTRLQETPRVEKILEEERLRFMDYLETLSVLPLIAELHKHAESIRKNVLEKSFRKLPDLSEEEKTRIEAMSRSLVKQILEAPIMRLRAEARCPYGAEYAAVARRLFDLEGGAYYCMFASDICRQESGIPNSWQTCESNCGR